MMLDPTTPSYTRLHDAELFRKCKTLKQMMYNSQGATFVLFVMATFCQLCPAAEKHLQSLASAAFSSGVVDRCVRLRTARQYLSRAFVPGTVFRHCHGSLA
jgi:hypothetical protein